MRVLDLFCGAGGAAWGLHKVWPNATIIGIDNRPQPRYPFRFVQGDVLRLLNADGIRLLRQFDFIWASPPCQAFTPLRARHPQNDYPDHIQATRALLKMSRLPYIIENVPQAPIVGPILCGAMFPGLRVYRHRRFESNCHLKTPEHRPHLVPTHSGVGQHQRKAHYQAGGFLTVTGHIGSYAGPAMGIDWMTSNELVQAIPPIYAAYLALQISTTRKRVDSATIPR